MQFKLAVLTALAKRADGRATLDELRREIETLADRSDQEISSALDNIDIFQSRLVAADGNRFRITQRGRATLASIETSADLPATSGSHSLKAIDDLAGKEERQKILDLQPRSDEITPHAEGIEAGVAAHPKPMAPHLPPDAPAFLRHDGFGPHVRTSRPETSWRTSLSRLISARWQELRAIWRSHVEPDRADVKARPKQTSNVSGAAIALLSLLAILICAGTLIALTQTRALKTEAIALQREVTLLKERVARMEYERATQELNRQTQSANKLAAEQNRDRSSDRNHQTALNLTQDDIQLIREYIKPAPTAGTPAPAINVGDTVATGTIPLPSQLMEKIPKLLGARFTTRNGSIIILRRGSQQADAVLSPG